MSNENATTYCNCMAQIRQRISLIQRVLDRTTTTGEEVFDIEIIFVQFRKILELIAFSTLTANKEKYSIAHANFALHWNAKSMLSAVEKLNPDFYPVPHGLPEILPTGIKNITGLAEGFLTKKDFELLYDKSSEVLHVRNPFATKDPVIDIGYSAAQWVARIQRLLALHYVTLIDETKWMVQIPSEGPIQLLAAVPV